MSTIPSIDLTLEDSDNEMSPGRLSVPTDPPTAIVKYSQTPKTPNLHSSEESPLQERGEIQIPRSTVRLPGLSRISSFRHGKPDTNSQDERFYSPMDPVLFSEQPEENAQESARSLFKTSHALGSRDIIRDSIAEQGNPKRFKLDTHGNSTERMFQGSDHDHGFSSQSLTKGSDMGSFTTDDFVTPQSPKFHEDLLDKQRTTPITSNEEGREDDFLDAKETLDKEHVEFYDLDVENDEGSENKSILQNTQVPNRSTEESQVPFRLSNELKKPSLAQTVFSKLDSMHERESSPIIILSDGEDDLPTSLKQKHKDSNSNLIRQSPGFEGTKPSLDAESARAAYEKLTKEMAEKERQLSALKNTYRDTKTILQRKLSKRDALIKDSENKLNLLIKSMENTQSLNKKLLIDRTADDTKSLKEKRTNTLLKLHELEQKESQLKDRFVEFVNDRNSKLHQSQLDLRNAINDNTNKENIHARASLLQEKVQLDAMYANGLIAQERYARSMTEINGKLNRLQSPNGGKSSESNPMRTSVFFKSIDVAKDLIAKNTVRSTQNKNLMYYLLKVLEDFKRDFDAGVSSKNSRKNRVENAITELHKHGVKMPAVSKYLESLGFIVDPDTYDRLKRSRLHDDDFISPDELDMGAHGDDDLLGTVKSQNGPYQYNSLQLSNIYTAQDDESLHELLEGLKKTETEVKGEELTPPELTVNLMNHQRQGLHWLLATENSNKKGGLLADDMGLGKTVQAIALMLRNRSELEKCKTNLIVAPVAVLRVWQAEIKTKVKKTANFRAMIYGGTSGSKVTNYRQLLSYDVVLVSYQTLASELKKHWPLKLKQDEDDFKLPEVADMKALNSLKEIGSEYWSPFFCNESQFYRIILDEAQNIKNKNTKAAKACCSLESIYRWALSGTPMQNSIMELYSLVRFLRIPPYNKEHRFRIDIGNPLGKTSGNYDDYDRKQAIKKVQVLLTAIMLRRTKDSEIDGKPILELPDKNIHNKENTLSGEESQFYEQLESANQKKAEKLLARSAKGSYSSILTLLLRLRQACCHPELVKIGENKSENSKVVNGKNFEKDWLRLYEVAYKIPNLGKETISDGLENMLCPYCMEQMELETTMVLTPCGHMLCEGCLQPFLEDARYEPGSRKIANGGHIVSCLVCKRDVNDNEVITYRLYDQVINQKFSEHDLHEEYKREMAAQKDRLKNGYRTDFANLEPSQKISECLEIIKNVLEKDDDEKIIIFSQFTTFFDLLQHFIRKELEIPFLRYDGSMDSKARAVTVEEFYRDKTKRVLLISMKAGNAGLTLTCANHVVLVDPFWNPFVEDQAMDRCYRISQTREVQVYRLLVKNSVEDRILELQKKKRELVDSAMDPTKIREVNSLGRHELGFLFGLNSLNNGGTQGR